MRIETEEPPKAPPNAGADTVVVILTVPLGSGHTSAAHAIASALAGQRVRVEVIDISRKLFKRFRFDRLIRRLYRWFTTWWGGRIHGAIYRFADRHPGFVSRLIDLALGRRIAKWVEEVGRVDAFICTFPIVGFVLDRRISRRTKPLIAFITDTGKVNRIWFAGLVDKFIVSGNETKAHAMHIGVPAARVAVARPPITTDMDPLPGKHEARKILGLDDRFTILLTAGGDGLGNGVLAAARMLARSDLNIQLIMNAGGNKKLLRHFHGLSLGRKDLVVGFTPDFPLLITACDVVVTKEGWLTINEAMALRRPMLIVDVLPGQETANYIFAKGARAGYWAEPVDVPRIVQHYMVSRAALNADFNLDNNITSGRWTAELREAIRSAVLIAGGAHAQ